MPPKRHASGKAKKYAASPLLVKASDFKARCLDLMDEVQQRGVWVVVTKRGKPVAKLGPVDDSPPNPYGFLRGTVVSDAGLVDAEHDTWTPSSSDPLS